MKNNGLKKHSMLKRVVCATLAILLIYVAGSIVTSMAVFHYVFHRTEYPRTFELNYSDIDKTEYPRDTVNFTSGDNKLVGYLYRKENAPGTIIIVNGVFSGADRHLSEIMFFLDNGWQVFAFDGTGVGDSGGDGIVGLQQTKLDLQEAIKSLKEFEKSDAPLFLYGHSAGGYASISVLGSTQGIAAVVSIAGFNSPVETMYFHARQKVGVLANIEYPFLWLQNRILFGDDSDITALSVLNRTDTPVMIVEGSDDTVVPGDIGIGKYENEFLNPNAKYYLIDAPYRNSHTTIWLSTKAAKKMTAANNEEESTAALPAYTRFEMNEVDSGFLLTVLDFYKSAIK